MKRPNAIQLLFFLAIFSVIGKANAQPTQLCSAIDGSGSISGSDFHLQLVGLASAIEDPAVVPQDGSVAVSVVQFSDTAVLELAPTIIDSQATANAAGAVVRAITQIGAGTAIGDGINACAMQFNFSTGKQIIDISTDGLNTTGADPVTAANAAVAAGVDTINALGVGTGVDQAELQNIVRPQPPSPFPEDGFVLLINNFTEYAQATATKIQAEVNPPPAFPVPAPGIPAASETAMLLLMALMVGIGFFVSLRRQTMR